MAHKKRRQAGKKPKFEITREMVEAATHVLNGSGAVEVPTLSNRALVLEMLEAAISAGGFSTRTP